MSFAMSAINYNNQQFFAYASTGNDQQTSFNPFNTTPYQQPEPQPMPYYQPPQYQCQNQQQDMLALLLGLSCAIDSTLSQNSYPSFSNLDNIVAANERGTITGDPHFLGGDGGRYDVQGEPGKVYNLLSDTNLNFNGRFDAWGSNGATIVGETALNVSDLGGNQHSTVTFAKDGVAKVNGQELQDGQTVVLADGGTATKDGNKLIIQTAEGYTITQSVHGSCNGNYINTEVKTSALGVATDNVLPGGLLGQTFDPDNVARNGARGAGAQGEGAIDGVVGDYETSLNTFGDQKLDENGNVIQESDPFVDMVSFLASLLNPKDPNVDFLSVLSFVMNAVFMLIAGGFQQQQQQQY